MRQIYTELGLESTQLLIRDADTGKESRRLGGEELLRVVELLSRLEELVRVIQRRGIDFAEFLAKRDQHGRLPLYRVVVEGEEHFFHDSAQRDTFLRQENLLVEDEDMKQVTGNGDKPKGENGDSKMRRLQKNQELHEVKDLEKLFSQLEQYGLSIDDYFLTQEESVAGEKLATKYALLHEEKTHDVAGVAQLLPEIHGLGKQGMEVKRFKGLGEMNAEELW